MADAAAAAARLRRRSRRFIVRLMEFSVELLGMATGILSKQNCRSQSAGIDRGYYDISAAQRGRRLLLRWNEKSHGYGGMVA